jgi:hypothetical protein
MYFHSTVIVTAGLGDFYPVSNPERILNVVIMITGASLTSLIVSKLLDMVFEIKDLHVDYE